MDQAARAQLARVQIAMWLPAKCAVCGKAYESVDDFMARNPRANGAPGQPWEPDPDTGFVDDACWKPPADPDSQRAGRR